MCLEILLHSDCFCCMWYLLSLEFLLFDWLVNWLGNWVLEGHWGGVPCFGSTHIHTYDRLDKSCRSLAEA